MTIKDIASKLDISFQAVSQALNPPENTSHVSESTRKRVEEAARTSGGPAAALGPERPAGGFDF